MNSERYYFLLTWRLARRFGGRGLAIARLLAAVPGPFRDSAYMARFPDSGVLYGQGGKPCQSL